MDYYNKEAIEKEIKTKWLGRTLIYQDIVDSTNEVIKKKINQAKDGLLVVADSQSAGKGSKGRSWASPSGSGVWMSYLLKPEFEAHQACELTLLVSFCVVKILIEKFEIDAKIKWPNDVILGGKKIAGILTEMCFDNEKKQCLITGVGINVNQEFFPDELSIIASSILMETGKRISRKKLIAEILDCIEREYEQYLKNRSLETIIKEYNERLIHLNKEVRIIIGNKEIIALSKGINKRGKLEVEYQDGKKDFINLGELSIRGLSTYI